MTMRRRDHPLRCRRYFVLGGLSAAGLSALTGCSFLETLRGGIPDISSDDTVGYTAEEYRVVQALINAENFLQEIADWGNNLYGTDWFDDPNGGQGYGDTLISVKHLLTQWANADVNAVDEPIDPALSASLTAQAEAILEQAYEVSLAGCQSGWTQAVCDIDITTKFKAPGTPGGAPTWIDAWWDFSS